MSTAQSPAFVAAVQTYCQAFEGGTRDMRRLKPLIKRIDAAFVYQPGPAHAPLTEVEKADTVATWQQMDAAHDGQITKLADHLLEIEPAERARSIELWIAVIAVMRDEGQQATHTAPLGGAAYTKPIVNQHAAHAWERIQQITDDPTDDGRDAEDTAEDTAAIIAVLHQLDSGDE